MSSGVTAKWEFTEDAGWVLVVQVRKVKKALVIAPKEVGLLKHALDEACRQTRRVCLSCGEPFLARHPTAAYCSALCRTRASRARLAKPKPKGRPGRRATGERGGR